MALKQLAEVYAGTMLTQCAATTDAARETTISGMTDARYAWETVPVMDRVHEVLNEEIGTSFELPLRPEE